MPVICVLVSDCTRDLLLYCTGPSSYLSATPHATGEFSSSLAGACFRFRTHPRFMCLVLCRCHVMGKDLHALQANDGCFQGKQPQSKAQLMGWHRSQDAALYALIALTTFPPGTDTVWGSKGRCPTCAHTRGSNQDAAIAPTFGPVGPLQFPFSSPLQSMSHSNQRRQPQ